MRQTAARFSALGVTEISRTICELLEWKRANAGLKNHECRQLLERLQEQGRLRLPPVRRLGPRGPRRVDASPRSDPQAEIRGSAGDFEPIELTLVEAASADSARWREWMARYHYLGYRVPVGANLRYLVRSPCGDLACVQWSSPAWKMAPRDHWIGWNDQERKCNLPYIVNHTRFLILPWVRWPARSWHTVRADCRETGSDSMDTIRCCWRPWLMANALPVLATVQRTGFRWDKPKGAVGWIVTMNYTAKLRTDLCLSGLLRCEAAALLSLCLPHPYNVPDRLTMVNKYPWIRDGEHLVFVEARMVQARIARRATKGQRLTVK